MATNKKLATRLREAAECDGEHRWSAFMREIAEALDSQEFAWDRECCRQEREACAKLAQEEEERGWGRKGFHRVADAIRGRGEWIAYLSNNCTPERRPDKAQDEKDASANADSDQTSPL